jgi:hypothetical protein
MPQVGFELTIPVFQRAKTFLTLGRAASVTGQLGSKQLYNFSTAVGSYEVFVYNLKYFA